MCLNRRTGMLLVIAMALSATIHGQQQAQRPYHEALDSDGGPFTDVPVLDAPFSADAVTTVREALPDGAVREHTVTAHYDRDSFGRVRAGLDTAWGQFVTLDLRRGPWRGVPDIHRPDVRYTDDSTGPGAVFVLNPAKRTFRLAGLHIAQTVFNGDGRVALPVAPVEFRLAPRVEGATRAARLRTVNAELSAELSVVIASHRADQIGSVEYKLTNIRRDEPPADVFTVPSSYTFVRGSHDDPIVVYRPWPERRP